LRGGVESEVPIVDQDKIQAALIKKLLSLPPTRQQPSNAETTSTPGVRRDGNEAVIDLKSLDPDAIGTTSRGTTFVSPNPSLSFSGIMWFGPKNFTLYIGNPSQDLIIESRKNVKTRAYEVDLSNSEARLRFSIRKEVRVEETWLSEFDE
jgi:hypothetical protein